MNDVTPATMAQVHAAAFDDEVRVWSETAISTLLADPTVKSVSIADSGFALIRVIPPEAEILTLAVLPDAQGQGYGKALMTQAIAMAQKIGITTMLLEVGVHNIAARSLYATLGFREVARRPAYYRHSNGQRSDALLMLRLLS